MSDRDKAIAQARAELETAVAKLESLGEDIDPDALVRIASWDGFSEMRWPMVPEADQEAFGNLAYRLGMRRIAQKYAPLAATHADLEAAVREMRERWAGLEQEPQHAVDLWERIDAALARLDRERGGR